MKANDGSMSNSKVTTKTVAPNLSNADKWYTPQPVQKNKNNTNGGVNIPEPSILDPRTQLPPDWARNAPVYAQIPNAGPSILDPKTRLPSSWYTPQFTSVPEPLTSLSLPAQYKPIPTWDQQGSYKPLATNPLTYNPLFTNPFTAKKIPKVSSTPQVFGPYTSPVAPVPEAPYPSNPSYPGYTGPVGPDPYSAFNQLPAPNGNTGGMPYLPMTAPAASAPKAATTWWGKGGGGGGSWGGGYGSGSSAYDAWVNAMARWNID